MSERARYEWLPETLAEIAEVAGLEAALRLARAKGGTEIYIPAKLKPGHWLIEAVGAEAAEALRAHYATGCSIRLPVGPASTLAELRRVADDMIAKGRSNAEVALTVGYSERAIRYRRSQLGHHHDPRQKRLI